MLVLLVTVAILVALALLAPPADAYEVRLRTGNDILVTDQDDLYTFAVALQLERGPYTVTFLENAFTDRAAGLRFDESHLTVGRELPLSGPWNAYAEAGVVRVGEGLFGEGAQNAVHELLGGEEVELAYVESSLHGRAALTTERSFGLARELEIGPRLELEVMPGLRSHAVVGAQIAWGQPTRPLSFHAVLGARFTDASHAALEEHLVPVSPVARLGVLVKGRLALSWNYNEYGDEREHLSLGLRVAPRAPRTPEK
jgi:hypothetical protein